MSAAPQSEIIEMVMPANPVPDVRREERREGLRQVDYGPFPRTSLVAGSRLGLLINESNSGLCLVSNQHEEVGTLLRVVIRGLHGHTSRDVVARVVWCRKKLADRCLIGLELIRESSPQMARVRHINGRRTYSGRQAD